MSSLDELFVVFLYIFRCLYMHFLFFKKHFFFCVMSLSIGIHATNSVAESSDRTLKTTSILSVFAKAVVLGLAFGSQLQVLASPSPKKQTPS